MKYEDLDLIFTKKLISTIEGYQSNNISCHHDQILDNLSRNPNISLDIIDQCSYWKPLQWDWSWGLSRHPRLTIEFIEKHIDKPWNWGAQGLSKHPIITSCFLMKYSDSYRE